jgi:lipid-A-disaccharide synthase
VLIDYPGFNWWIARRAKAHGIPVFYYTPPQVWAWAQWRVKKMRRLVDHVLCALPFEAKWFREKGCNATFVGHPFFDEVAHQQVDTAFVERMRGGPGPLVAILPGSRTQEVVSNLEWFLKAAEQVRAAVPDARFAIASFKPQQAEIARRQVAQSGLPIEVFVGRTPELIRAATCCMAVSGSVSLELLAQAKPTVILYWISRGAYRVQSHFRKVKYITLVNLLVTDDLFPKDVTPYDPGQADAERVLYPEYLTWEDKTPQIARHVVQWLTAPAERAALEDRLVQLREQVGHGGASRHAAEYILQTIGR